MKKPETDLDAMTAINQDPKVCEYLPSIGNRKQTEEFINRMMKHHQEKGFFFAVELKTTGEMIGFLGSGKTAVLNELARRGFLTVPEVARTIIQKQQTIGGDATHTGNRSAFCDLLLEQSIADYRQMESEKNCVFFDRGIPDLYGYASAFCEKISTNVITAVTQFRYNKVAFIFPPWQRKFMRTIASDSRIFRRPYTPAWRSKKLIPTVTMI